jgi:hypothetical protein
LALHSPLFAFPFFFQAEEEMESESQSLSISSSGDVDGATSAYRGLSADVAEDEIEKTAQRELALLQQQFAQVGLFDVTV